MPITNYKISPVLATAAARKFPRWLRKRLESFGDDGESLKPLAWTWFERLCETLLITTPPVYIFYTMNQTEPPPPFCATQAGMINVIPRVYVPLALSSRADISSPETQAHYLTRVLRMEAGQAAHCI